MHSVWWFLYLKMGKFEHIFLKKQTWWIFVIFIELSRRRKNHANIHIENIWIEYWNFRTIEIEFYIEGKWNTLCLINICYAWVEIISLFMLEWSYFFVFLCYFFFYENFPSDFYLLVLFILIKLICYKKNCNFYIKSSCIDSTRAESILFVRRKRRRQTEWMKHVWMFILSIGWNFFHKYT